jgi:hypothetical protein
MERIRNRVEETINGIRENELEKDLFLIKNKSETYKNLELSFSKKNLCHYIIKKELQNGIEYLLDKEADMCIGFITSEKCKLQIYTSKNNVYEIIHCNNGKNNLLQKFIYFDIFKNHYQDFYFKADKNIEIKFIYTFLENDIRHFICQNNIEF